MEWKTQKFKEPDYTSSADRKATQSSESWSGTLLNIPYFVSKAQNKDLYQLLKENVPHNDKDETLNSTVNRL